MNRMLSHLVRLSLLAFVGWMPCAPAATEPSRLTIAVGGKSLFYYLPLTVAERLGYFRDEGLDVTIADFPGGAKALQSLVGGSADMVAGAYEHVVSMQAKKQPLRAVVVQGRHAGIVLGLTPEWAARYRSPADLKGLKVGVSAPGSSTNLFINVLLAKAGLKPDAVSIIGVGTSGGAIAAVRKRQVDAIAVLDPAASMLQLDGDIVGKVDTRTAEGQKYVYGADYAAAVLYTREEFVRRHPQRVQSAVNAMVRALRWLQRASPDAIVALVPPEYYGEHKTLYRIALGRNFDALSPDGMMSMAAARNVYQVLHSFEPSVQQAGELDLAQTFDNRFVIEALRKYK